MNIILKLPPSNNHYLDYKVARKGKKLYVESYHSKETEQFLIYAINYLKEEIQKQNWKTPNKEKFIKVECIFYMPRKKSDNHNYFKVAFDAMTKAGIWQDDDKVLPDVKNVYIDSINPRIEMRLIVMNKIGIFNNKKEKDLYINNNCKKCSKNYNKCVILKELLDNKVTNKNNCEKFLKKGLH